MMGRTSPQWRVPLRSDETKSISSIWFPIGAATIRFYIPTVPKTGKLFSGTVRGRLFRLKFSGSDQCWAGIEKRHTRGSG